LAWTDREQEFIDHLCDRGQIAAELIADDAADQAGYASSRCSSGRL
jgi:hypothetical protein